MLAVYAIAAFFSGVVLSVVFQLAHCVEEADFPTPVATARRQSGSKPTGPSTRCRRPSISPARNRVLCWFLGGLNFQIEHHLFHKICHVHYPALSKVVEEVCREFGVRYTAHRSFFAAVGSHFRFLVLMGRPVAQA